MPKSYNPIYDPNFVGYYCAAYNEEEAGIIKNTEENADNRFLDILNALPLEIKKKAEKKGLLKKPKRHGKSFDEWSSKVYKFFKDEWIRWIPVNEKEPDEDKLSEEICFYVSIPEEEAIIIFDGSGTESDSSIIVFISKGTYKSRPKLIPIPEEVDDIMEDVEDDEEKEEEEEESVQEEDDSDWSMDEIWNGRRKR